MIIDAHAHIFPNMATAAGYKDAQTHLSMQQERVGRFWGRMVSSSLDEAYRPEAKEDIQFRVGKYGRYYWTKHGETSWLQRFPPMMQDMEWTPEQMLAFMDACGVAKAVLQAVYMEADYCVKYFSDCIRKWPDRFVGTVSIDYDLGKSDDYRQREIRKLEHAVLEGGMKGVYQGFSRNQPIASDAFNPFWEAIARLKIPHIFLTGFQAKKPHLKQLDQIETVLKRFPEITGVIGHLGGNVRSSNDPNFTDTPKELMPILKLPNAYFEVGYVLAYENWDIWQQNYEYPYPLHTEVIKEIYHEIGAQRLIWGSDMPNIYRTCTYQQCVDLVKIHFDFMSEEEKQLILGGTAATLYGMQE
jgi:predicted TIM-barrel fold metal-dependent hydrolase